MKALTITLALPEECKMKQDGELTHIGAKMNNGLTAEVTLKKGEPFEFAIRNINGFFDKALSVPISMLSDNLRKLLTNG